MVNEMKTSLILLMEYSLIDLKESSHLRHGKLEIDRHACWPL